MPSSTAKRWTLERSAGGVVLRDTGARREVLVIQPVGKTYWQLPKGWIEAGEMPESAALREVREETGVEAEVVAPLDPVKYFYQRAGQRIAKSVEFFVMRYRAGSTDDHDHEVAEARWVAAEEAVSMLSFESERAVVQTALDRPTATVSA
jgi:8-oxo-dGTP pyrophosphatase MutT (NUDIX family)